MLNVGASQADPSARGRLIAAGFAVSLVIFVLIALISNASISALRQHVQRVEHAQNVLRETETVLSQLKDVETGVRGFLISRLDAYLEPYVQAQFEIPNRIAGLKQLTSDNPEQQQDIATLERLTGLHLARAAEVLRIAENAPRSFPPELREELDEGRLLMDQIRTLVSQMRAREENLLTRFNDESERSANRTVALIIAGNLASFSILIAAFLLLRREIGKHAQARHAAQVAAADVADLYNHAPCGYHSLDASGIIVRINDTALTMLGYARDEIVGKKRLPDLMAPEFAETWEQNFRLFVEQGRLDDREYEFRRKDGSTFIGSLSGVAVRDQPSSLRYSRSTMIDVTERRAIENRLRESNSFLDAIVENIPSMIFVKHADTLKFARFNRAAEQVLGRNREDMVGRSDHDFFPAEQADFFTARDRDVLNGDEVVDIGEERILTAGGMRILHTRKISLHDADGRPWYLLGISDDITEHIKARDDIEKLNAALAQRANQLETANRELEGFTYSVSHDLRAPLRAIDGFARIFAEDYGDRLDGEGRRLLKVIRDNSQRMGVLIDDLLAFSRMGRNALATEPVDMNKLAEEAVKEIGSAHAGPAPHLSIAKLPDAWGDAAMLKQVWLNLLSNAFKYSSAVPVPVISISAEENADGTNIYCVRDNGAGFDMRYYDKLFNVFQRLHSAEEFPGTGVGLAIVQRIVSRHGGRAWGQATPGQGASFYFSLPRRHSQ